VTSDKSDILAITRLIYSLYGLVFRTEQPYCEDFRKCCLPDECWYYSSQKRGMTK